MYQNHILAMPNRIISISQPWLMPIVRGKLKFNVGFGANLDINVTDGWVRFEYQSFEIYNVATNLLEIIE